ncbi:Exosome complex component CSL4 [Oryzias melastigma]|uniref:Exosome complex component CSL4 n=1 Tax=Oryzias melastigma TaxID=30732 RepID=A0A834FTW5_ORYME|nr:Exosome complex component CSL4 [Oryzias melastigma]
MSPTRLCVPGDKLCSVEDCIMGTGVYLRHGYIYSSLAGYVLRKNEGEELPVISVVRETEVQLLPDVGAIVTCKVTSINSRFAKVHILYVGSTPLKDLFRGTIRKEDVRATEKDKVEMHRSFRPGDIVLAKVISLGDVQSNYLLTTAENELGVVVAHSDAGEHTVTLLWRDGGVQPQVETGDRKIIIQFMSTSDLHCPHSYERRKLCVLVCVSVF